MSAPTVYNVAREVVELIEANSPEEADLILVGRLNDAGFSVMETRLIAFEDEDQTPLAERNY
jgi:hypothetical protein